MSANLSRRYFLAAGASLLLASLDGCSRRGSSKKGSPQRVVSLSPNMTEAVFALERGSRLVGRSRYCDFPPEVNRIPQVGGFADPSMEAILSLRPQLVIGARGPAGPALAEKLRRHGIDTYFPSTDSIAQIEQALRGLGQRLDANMQADKLVHGIEVQLERVHNALRGRQVPTVLLLFGHRPLVACGPNTFPDEMLRRAGARNVLRTGKRYPVLDVETLLRLDPDVIVDAAYHAKEADIAPKEITARLRAVQNRRMVMVRDEAVLRPGPRVAVGVARLAMAIHPGLEVRI